MLTFWVDFVILFTNAF